MEEKKESTFTRIMNRVADLVILNVLYFISCIPIVTLGAARAALFDVCYRFDTPEEHSVAKTYWAAFRSNFKQATGLWLLMGLLGSTAAVDVVMLLAANGKITGTVLLSLLALVLVLMVQAILFPLISRFQNTWGASLKNALLLTLAQFPKALLLGFLEALPVGLWLLNPWVFVRVGFLFVLIYFALVGWLAAALLRKTFARLAENSKEA